VMCVAAAVALLVATSTPALAVPARPANSIHATKMVQGLPRQPAQPYFWFLLRTIYLPHVLLPSYLLPW
jgi:hypothetical protein